MRLVSVCDHGCIRGSFMVLERKSSECFDRRCSRTGQDCYMKRRPTRLVLFQVIAETLRCLQEVQSLFQRYHSWLLAILCTTSETESYLHLSYRSATYMWVTAHNPWHWLIIWLEHGFYSLVNVFDDILTPLDGSCLALSPKPSTNNPLLVWVTIPMLGPKA